MANVEQNPIVGRRYGRLIVIEYLGKVGYSRTKVRAQCDCGKIKDFFLNNLQRKGHTQSCGCYRNEESLTRSVTHGMRKHPLYRIWADMKTRCYNKNVRHFHKYGGRGVTMCDEWRENPERFIEWALANGWQKGLRIDKDKKVKGNLVYGPEFCSILTDLENTHHTRRNKYIEFNGVTKCSAEWARSLRIESSKFHYRIKKCGYNLTHYFQTWGHST